MKNIRNLFLQFFRPSIYMVLEPRARIGKISDSVKAVFWSARGLGEVCFEAPTSREHEIAPPTANESPCKFRWLVNKRMLLTSRHKLSDHILMRRTCGRVDLSLVTELLHLCGQPPTINPSHLPHMSKPYNIVFQTLLVPAAYLFRIFCLFSLNSSWSRGVL